MKLISFVSFKGGAGKTTALMAIASVLVARGHRITLLEADENAPLSRWRQNAELIGTWSDLCGLAPGDTVQTLQESLDVAERDGCAFALADTAGGGSDLNTLLIANSDLVLVPTTLAILDLDEAITTMQFVVEGVSESVGRKIDTRLLFTRFPQSRLKTTEQKNLNAVQPLPQFTNRLSERAAFSDLKLTGLLDGYRRILSASPAKRFLASHSMMAIGEAQDVTEELIGIVGD